MFLYICLVLNSIVKLLLLYFHKTKYLQHTIQYCVLHKQNNTINLRMQIYNVHTEVPRSAWRRLSINDPLGR